MISTALFHSVSKPVVIAPVAGLVVALLGIHLNAGNRLHAYPRLSGQCHYVDGNNSSDFADEMRAHSNWFH